MADWNARQSSAQSSNFQPPALPQPVPPFSGAPYSNNDSSLVPYNNGAHQRVANGPFFAHQQPPRYYNASNAYTIAALGNMMRQYPVFANGYNNNWGYNNNQYQMIGPPPPNVSQAAIINSVTDKIREEEQKKFKTAQESMENTIKELTRQLRDSKALVKKQQTVIQNREPSSSSNASELLVPDIQGEEHQENEKLKEKLKNLEVENHQLRHGKNDVNRFQEILKTENLKLVAMVKEKNSVDVKLQDCERKLKEAKDSLAEVNVKFKVEVQRMRKEREQVLSRQTSPGGDSKDLQIEKLQDALENEKKKVSESQAQCAKEKEKVAHLEHRFYQKMKEVQDSNKDMVSKEVQTEKLNTARRSTVLGKPVTERNENAWMEHAKSLKIRICEIKTERDVMSGELRELKRKLSTDDQKTVDRDESEHKKKKMKKDKGELADSKESGKLEKKKESSEKSSGQKPVETVTNDEKSEGKDKDKESDGTAKIDRKKERKDGKSENSSDHKPVDTATNDDKPKGKDEDKAKESDEIAKNDKKKKEQKGGKSESFSDRNSIDTAATKDGKKSNVSEKVTRNEKEPESATKDQKKPDKAPEVKMNKKEKKTESLETSSDESLVKLAPKPIRKRGRPAKYPENSGAPKPKKMKHIE